MAFGEQAIVDKEASILGMALMSDVSDLNWISPVYM